MIIVRLDLIKRLKDRDFDVNLATYALDQVPNVGEIINVKGDPRSVFERGWSVDNNGVLFCYIRLLGINNPENNNEMPEL